MPQPPCPGVPPGYIDIIDDYGPVGRGASNARYVLAENGSEYLIKGPTLSPNHFYVAANELVAAGLARVLGLPVLDSRVVRMNGELFFASAYMSGGTYYERTTPALVTTCANRDRVTHLVVFDVWLCNVDRHEQNLIVRKITNQRSQQTRHLLLLNDHSHCLVPAGGGVQTLFNLASSPADHYVQRFPFLKQDALRDLGTLRQAIAAAQSVSQDTIERIVGDIPDSWLRGTNDRDHFVDFLLARQSQLPALFSPWGVDMREAAS